MESNSYVNHIVLFIIRKISFMSLKSDLVIVAHVIYNSKTWTWRTYM